MAQTQIVGNGLVIEGDIGEATNEGHPETVHEELARKAIQRLNQGFPKAALAYLVELTNMVAQENDLGGGAWL